MSIRIFPEKGKIESDIFKFEDGVTRYYRKNTIRGVRFNGKCGKRSIKMRRGTEYSIICDRVKVEL